MIREEFTKRIVPPEEAAQKIADRRRIDLLRIEAGNLLAQGMNLSEVFFELNQKYNLPAHRTWKIINEAI